MCLGNILRDYTINNIKKRELKEVVKVFCVDYNAVDTNNILDIHRYLIRETWYKIMSGFFKKMFIGLLTNVFNASNPTKCVSFNNQQCMTQPSLINLHPNEYNQELHYYLTMANSERCVGSCNTINDLFNKVYVPNKTKDLNLSVYKMITGINQSKTLRKHISCK